MKRPSNVIPFRKPARLRRREKALRGREKQFKKRVEEHLHGLVSSELARFADNLAIARAVWRQHPALVTSQQIPTRLRKAFMEENSAMGYSESELLPWLDGHVDYGRPTISPEQMRELRERAERYAREEGVAHLPGAG
jgi:hypothetical protein